MKKRKRIVMKIIHQKLRNQVNLYRENFPCLPHLMSVLKTAFVGGKKSVVPFLSYLMTNASSILLQTIPRNHWAVRKRVGRIGMNWRKKPEKVKFC